MNPVPYLWIFRIKGLNFYKARCCVRGDLQHPFFEFDPDGLYAPGGSHEAIRMILCMAARDGLIVEGGDISIAYL